MEALAEVAFALCAWLIGSLLWAGLVQFLASRSGGTAREAWPSFWLAWVVLAAAPPLAAPLLAVAPAPVMPLQVEAALVLTDWTAPLQSGEAAFGGGVDFAMVVVAGLFCIGIARGLWRLAADLVRAMRVARAAEPVGPANSASLPLNAAEIGGERVPLLLSGEHAANFCIGGAQPKIVLSRGLLRRITPEQARMVVRHELAHVQRGDPLLFAALACLDAVFWFNPFLRRLTNQARLAAEIACDAIALEPAGATRQAYARALVQALEHETRTGALAAFGRRAENPRIRLAHILRGGVDTRARGLSALIVALAIAASLSGTAMAATTARLAVFGDPAMLSALGARVSALYGAAPHCDPGAAKATLNAEVGQ